jgi:hypothetical protein
MPRIARLLNLSIAATALVLVPTTLTNRAQGDSGCNAARLSGPYGIKGNGFVFGAPSAFAGTFVFDGKDKTSGSYMLNLGGEVDKIDLSGTYTVNSGCDGAMTIFTTHHKPPVEHFHAIEMVVVDGGREVLFIYGGPKRSATDSPPPGVIFSGALKRL